MTKSAAEEFLGEVNQNDTESILDKPLEAEVAPANELTEAEKEEKHKNRAFRRLEEKYQKEREMGIALNARLQALSEVSKFREEVGDDHLKEVEAIFGTDTPEKLQATNILKKALDGMSEKAVEKALNTIKQRESEASDIQKKEDDAVDEMANRVEDDYGLDMSDDNVRTGFFTLMEKMSPKDVEGNIKEYADQDAVAEAFVELRKRQTSSRAKDLASRSMTRSGTSAGTTEKDPTWEYLRRELGW